MREIEHGIELWRQARATIARPYWLYLLASAKAACYRAALTPSGQGPTRLLDEARQAVKEAIELAEAGCEYWWLAELYRFDSVLAFEQGNNEATAGQLAQAARTAKLIGSLALELRITSTYLLFHRQREPAAATPHYDRLRALRDEFREGADTADLRTATALLGDGRPAVD